MTSRSRRTHGNAKPSDDAFAQAVHSRHSYVAADLRFDARLVDVMAKSRDGRLRIDLRRFHDVERLEKT
jgi:inward rectifier potassium channel